MLKMTVVMLVKISDIGKYLFIKKGLSGRISCIAKRHAKANNKNTREIMILENRQFYNLPGYE